MDLTTQIARVFASAGVQYSATITFTNIDIEAVKGDAVSFYVWKLQRQVREASVDQRAKWAKDGITLHYSEVGKPVVDTGELMEKMSDEQAAEAFELLKARLANKDE